MTPEVEFKVLHNIPLNKREMMQATKLKRGYMLKIAPLETWRCGLMTRSEFLAHFEAYGRRAQA